MQGPVDGDQPQDDLVAQRLAAQGQLDRVAVRWMRGAGRGSGRARASHASQRRQRCQRRSPSSRISGASCGPRRLRVEADQHVTAQAADDQLPVEVAPAPGALGSGGVGVAHRRHGDTRIPGIVPPIGHTVAMRRLSLDRAVIRLAAALSVALLLAACGTSGGATGTQNVGTQAAARTPQRDDRRRSRAPRPVSSTTTASAASGPPACRAAGLALRFLGQQGATGHGELGFAVRNTGSASCRTFGYPGVQFLDASGGGLPTRSQRVTDDFVGSLPVTEIVLAPGASASFRLGVTHGNASPAGCTTAHGLQAYPPG